MIRVTVIAISLIACGCAGGHSTRPQPQSSYTYQNGPHLHGYISGYQYGNHVQFSDGQIGYVNGSNLYKSDGSIHYRNGDSIY